MTLVRTIGSSASDTASGIITTSAQDIAGVKTFFDGIKADNAAGQSVLNYFRDDATSIAIAGMTTAPSITLLATRIGNVVVITLPASGLLIKNGTPGPMSVNIGGSFTPITSTSNYYGSGLIAGVDTAVLFQITTGGVINMYSSIGGNNISAGATNIGWNKQTIIFHIT